jgi:hypothetical protein
MNNLVFCPVGNPLTFDDRFDKENHWRYTKDNRNYETFVIQYGSYVPEEGTYDGLAQQSGFKWNLAKEYLEKLDYQKYEYVAFFDDDLITDIDNLNRSFELAKEKNLKLFQLSVTHDSDVFYPILRNKPGIRYTKTNFIEVMGPVIHTSLIPLCMELWDKYDIYSGWGFDKVLCDLTKEDAAVIHCSQMYHPKKESSYDKSNAFAEMDKLLNDVFPKFMQEKYKESWSFRESQIEKEMVMEIV